MVRPLSFPARMLNKYFYRRLLIALVALGIDMMIWAGENATVFEGYVPHWIIITIGVLGYSSLVITRSPIPGYLVLLVLSVGCLYVPAAPTMVGFCVALFNMARLLPRRQAAYALLGAVVPILACSSAAAKLELMKNQHLFLYGVLFWTVLMLATWAAGVAMYRYEHRIRTERVWAKSAREEATAMERLRISRDLHDSVAHSLTAIVLQTAGVRAVQRTGSRDIDIDAVLGDIQSTAEQSVRELHRLLGILRSENDEAKMRPQGVEDIQELIDPVRAAGFEVRLRSTGSQRPLDPSIAHAAYRVVQEGLSNVMRHAGQGARAAVELDWSEQKLTVEVCSVSGIAQEPAESGGFGLLGLRERITVSGGILQSGPTKNGFLLKAVLPVSNDSSMSVNRPAVEFEEE